MKTQIPLIMQASVQSADCNRHSVMKISSVARYFQEAAWKHAEDLGLGYTRLIRNDHVWVLHSQKLKIRKYPAWRDNIKIKTWGKRFDSLYALRDFYLWIEGDENPAISATTTWIVLSTVNHRPVRLSHYGNSVPVISENAVTEKSGSIENICQSSGEHLLKVRYSDIDINGHTNNASYFDFCMDSISELRKYHKKIDSVDIRYKNESLQDETIRIRYQKKSHEFLVDGVIPESGKEVFSACFGYS